MAKAKFHLKILRIITIFIDFSSFVQASFEVKSKQSLTTRQLAFRVDDSKEILDIRLGR